MPANLERPLPTKEDTTNISQDKGAPTPPRVTEKQQVCSGGRERSEGKAKARTFTGVSAGKASQHRVNNAGLAYLNNSGCRAVSPPPVPGPGIMQHKENTVLVCESDKEVTEG